jgi:hypothetical protein
MPSFQLIQLKTVKSIANYMENYIQQIEGTSLIKCSSRELWHLALIKYLQDLQNIICGQYNIAASSNIWSSALLGIQFKQNQTSLPRILLS